LTWTKNVSPLFGETLWKNNPRQAALFASLTWRKQALAPMSKAGKEKKSTSDRSFRALDVEKTLASSIG
jgi:hypothetical protein